MFVSTETVLSLFIIMVASKTVLVRLSLTAGVILLCGQQLAAAEAATTNNLTTANDKVQLEVYFESLCPDSRRLFVNQLGPLEEEMSQNSTNNGNSYIFDIKLVPFGKADIVGDEMDCQHGPEECLRNKLFACIIENTKSSYEALRLITCIFRLGYSKLATCYHNYLEDLTSEQAISDCSKSGQHVMDLMRQHGNQTGRLNYVPTIRIAGQPAQSCEFELKQCVCDRYKGPKTPSCSQQQQKEQQQQNQD